jgi:hypothetical protein
MVCLPCGFYRLLSASLCALSEPSTPQPSVATNFDPIDNINQATHRKEAQAISVNDQENPGALGSVITT